MNVTQNKAHQNMHRTDIVFDLTEIFCASTGRLPYYGIMQVTQQIGICLANNRDSIVHFGIFSYAYNCFIEVKPVRRTDGTVDLNVPQRLREVRVRQTKISKNPLIRILHRCAIIAARRINLRRWRGVRLDPVALDMTDKILVTASRPKIIRDALESLRKTHTVVKIVPILHDMIPLHNVSAYSSRKFLNDNQILLARATQILTVSNFTRQDILTFSQQGVLPKPPTMSVLPLAHECSTDIGVSSKPLPKEDYVLTVGATLGRKNLQASVNALDVLLSRGCEVPLLVIAGAMRKRTRKYLRQRAPHRVRDKILVIESPSPTDLSALYKGALAVIMASRMEGWGLPAGEALWLGTPAICSTAPALREVCGDLGLYFDPDDPAALADHILRLQSDADFRDIWRQRIKEAHPKLRRWQDVARELQSVLATV